MKIVIVGTGYVGLVTGACLADVGIDVHCIDIDSRKIEDLKRGILPIYEPGLQEIVVRNFKNGRLTFSTKIQEVLSEATAVFIAVGTPPNEDGSADMKYVVDVAREIGNGLRDYAVIVTKSTVPVGSSEIIRKTIQEELDARDSKLTFDMASNPEFLKEGAAVKDFMSPDRIVIGSDSERSQQVMDMIYKPFLLNGYRILYMDIASAEMTKYAANAMLATRISFMNDIASLCELSGANVNHVRAGVGSDPRIGKKFLYPGTGYGGSCFPKDVQALIKIGKDHGHPLRILQAVEDINNDQKTVIFKKIMTYFDGQLKDKTVAVWGLSFKPNTNDIRFAPAIVLIKDLLKGGATLKVFDPIAMPEAKAVLNNEVQWCTDVYETVEHASAIALMTEWNEFRLPDWKRIHSLMDEHVVFDGRNIYDRKHLQQADFDYFGIGI